MVRLYSTHCPKCKVIEMKLKQKNIDFELVEDLDKVMAAAETAGFHSAPILQIDDEYLDFQSAVKFINERK